MRAAHNVALIGYSILLQGAYTRSDREVPPQFAGPDSDERLRVLREVATESGCTLGQVIIAWMRQSDPAILPIIAGSKIEQLRESIAALDITLSSRADAPSRYRGQSRRQARMDTTVVTALNLTE